MRALPPVGVAMTVWQEEQVTTEVAWEKTTVIWKGYDAAMNNETNTNVMTTHYFVCLHEQWPYLGQLPLLELY
jgi:hypothetical protein